jgi:hemerythrin-like domain-containing protein
MMSYRPITRSKALLPLSREHHFDLLLAWKIRQGLSEQVALPRIAAYIRYLDEELIGSHFSDEERLLLDQLPREDSLCQRTRDEHTQIREIIMEICEGHSKDKSLFYHFADLMEGHVRYEERELFPYLEERLPEGELAQIEKVISRTHDVFCEQWEDAFWIK